VAGKSPNYDIFGASGLQFDGLSSISYQPDSSIGSYVSAAWLSPNRTL
jgi:hypothetical protein